MFTVILHRGETVGILAADITEALSHTVSLTEFKILPDWDTDACIYARPLTNGNIDYDICYGYIHMPLPFSKFIAMLMDYIHQ